MTITLVIAIIVESILPMERIAWRSRALGGLFISIIAASITIVAYLLDQLWQLLGVAQFFPPIEQWAGWAALPITLIVTDFLKYWEHRFEHRYFWKIHSVHHAPTDLHALTNYGHPLHAVPLFIFVALPLSILNFQSFVIPLAATLVLGVLNALSHSPVDFHFGPLRHVLIDNRFHRIHHSTDPRHFDRNFGVILSVWDRVFHTAYFPEPDEWPDVGLDGMAQPSSLGEFLIAPFHTANHATVNPHESCTALAANSME